MTRTQIFGSSQSSSVPPKALTTRPSALGMSDPVMEFLEFPEKGKNFWGRGEDFEGKGR